jgi:hypothetical protein
MNDDPAPFVDDPFFDVPRQRVRLSTGEVLMPALCRRVAVRLPLWFVDADAVAAQLDHPGIVPRRFGSRAVVALGLFSYGFATVGPYNEVGLLVVARTEERFRGVGHAGNPLRLVARVARGLAGVELALDSELALAGGRELLGLSKYLADVAHDLRGDRFRFEVRDRASGTPTVTVSGRVGPGVVVPSPRLVNLSSWRDTVIRVEVDTDSSWRIGPALGVQVACDPGDDHLGRRVAELGLSERRPFCVLSADDLRGRLHLGVRLDDGGVAGDVVGDKDSPQHHAASGVGT